MRSLPDVDIESGDVAGALRGTGCFYLRHPLFPAARCEDALAAARTFFDLGETEKRALSIGGSAHFRGYSEMRNERDWREQIHFGREEAAVAGGADYQRLRGPNLWPEVPGWREAVLGVMRDLETVGRAVLGRLGAFLPEEEAAYLLLKMIRYNEGAARPGVAAHVDFSWITLLIQDATGGLEICTPDGEWVAATPRAGRLVVNVGEVLQFATGGYYQATPHRVTTGGAARISLPFFLNPGLERVVERVEGNHVHRVLMDAPMHFGEAEWKRKGLGVWCAGCC